MTTQDWDFWVNNDWDEAIPPTGDALLSADSTVLATPAPELISITNVTSPRNTKVSSLDISFSAPIDPATFGLDDILILLSVPFLDVIYVIEPTGATLTQLTETSYRLDNLDALQSTEGTYRFIVTGRGIQDFTGNTVDNEISSTWELDTLAPPAADLFQVNGNPVNGLAPVTVSSTTLQVIGSVHEAGLRVFIRDKGLNQVLAEATVVDSISQPVVILDSEDQGPFVRDVRGTFASTVQLSAAGVSELEIQVVDGAGNTTTTALNVVAEVTLPEPSAVTLTQIGNGLIVTENGQTDTYSLVLNNQPAADVTLTLATDGQVTTDQATLTFTPENWATPQNVTVSAVNDTVFEGLHSSAIGHTLISSDPNFNNLSLPALYAAVIDNDAEIRSMTWHDLNGDGVKDADEPGLAGWTVYLDRDDQGVRGRLDPDELAVQTDGDGAYRFSELRPGSYTVAQVRPVGWRQTFPQGNNTAFLPGEHRTFLLEGDVATDLNFGNQLIGSPLPSHTDFNSDGFSDLIWRHPTTGQNHLWFLNNGSPVASARLLPDVADPSWKIEGTGDFDGDGLEDDLAWRNSATGQNVLWFTDLTVNGAELVGGAALPAVPDPAWKLQGVGDFDHDSFQDDLIWFNPGSEDLTVWFLQNGQPTGSTEINVGSSIGQGWEIAGVGSFDGGTHQDDILWRNALTSEIRVWFMEGTQPTGSAAISPQVLDADWRIEGVSDFNGDTVASDILWRNYATGTTTIWFMNGTTLAGGVSDIQPALDSSFVAVV